MSDIVRVLYDGSTDMICITQGRIVFEGNCNDLPSNPRGISELLRKLGHCVEQGEYDYKD